MSDIILASNSPRRKELMCNISSNFTTFKPNFKEIKKSSPYSLAMTNAKCKATASYQWDKLIISADTIVIVNNHVLNKPKDNLEAIKMLKMLSNTTHEVVTAVCVLYNRNMFCDYEASLVTFDKFSDLELEQYVAGGSPRDKAGAYGIQDQFIKQKTIKIQGNFDNVLGLPIDLTKRLCAFAKEEDL